MIKHLVVSCMDKFNLFLAKYGVSDYYSPETLVTGKGFDYLKHCQCKFGDYIQAQDYNDPRNDRQERCLDAIYLRPQENGTGHYIMDLHTGREITQGGKLTLIPLSESVKNSISKMRQRQGFKRLKFKKKSGQTMDHEDLVPEVDYNILNDYEEDVEDGEELFGEHSELVKEIEEGNFEEAENVPDDSNSEGKVEIDALIEEFNKDVLPEGEELLNNNNEEIEEEAEEEEEGESNMRPTRTQREQERLTYAQVESQGTLQLNEKALIQVMVEQEHNLFAQTVKCFGGVQYNDYKAVVMAQIIEQIIVKYNMGQQYLLHKGLKLFVKYGKKATVKEVGQLHNRTC